MLQSEKMSLMGQLAAGVVSHPEQWSHGEYREIQEPVVAAPPAGLDAAALSWLPAEMLAKLRRAAQACDPESFDDLLPDIGAKNPALGHSLAQLVNDFRFDEIVMLCDTAVR